MKRVASAVVSLCLIGGVLFANLQTASSQAPQQGRTLTFFDPRATDFEKQINEGRKGFSAGDWGVQKDRFFDPETCEKAGTLVGRFAFVKAIGRNDGFFIFDAGVLLPDGKLTFYWPGRFSEFAEGGSGAITGGTEAYAGAGGQLSVEEDVRMCDKLGALVTIELRP